MKQPFILLSALVLSLNLFAQYKSAPIGKVTYLHETSTEGGKELNGPATLLFNTDHSLYIHLSAPKGDSSFSNEQFYSYNISGDVEGFPIYKRHRERTMTCKITCNGLKKKEKYCLVSDTLGGIDWSIKPDFRRFISYTCQKAVGEFRGRTYEVWFTTEVPIPSGPFKLGGLPGLILEAKSTDGVVKFTFVSLEAGDNITEEIKSPTGYEAQMSHPQFIEQENLRNKQFLEALKAKGRSGATITRQEAIEIW